MGGEVSRSRDYPHFIIPMLFFYKKINKLLVTNNVDFQVHPSFPNDLIIPGRWEAESRGRVLVDQYYLFLICPIGEGSSSPFDNRGEGGGLRMRLKSIL